MNASLPPEDDRREELEQAAQPISASAGSGINVAALFATFVVVALLAMLLLPAIQHRRYPAPRSAQAELEKRQQAIEQAAREAGDEDRRAAQR